LWIAAHIVKWQRSDRRLVWKRKSRLLGHYTRCRDFGSKQEAAPLYGSNECLLLSSVADSSTDGINPTVQSSIGYSSPFPNLFDQFVLADYPVSIVGKVKEQIEHLRLHVNHTMGPPELPPVGID